MKKLITSKIFQLMVLALFTVVGLNAQTVTGTMTDADTNEPLIGANVLVKGTTVGTITDIDGSYSITLPEGATTLVFSYAGFADQEIDIAGQSVINVSLSPGALLDEVVVIGYGTVKKRDVTGSVASLKEEDFNKGIIVSTDQLLQGRVPGVNVVNNSGRPGGEATVKIRGNNSIRAGADPLYVVDGFPLDGRSARAGLLANDLGAIPNSNPLHFLNTGDIASIEILKDASSAAIYGARGANGVVLVTTKKGRSSEPTIDFNASFGASTVVKKYDVLTANEYRSALSNYGITTGGDGGADIDPFDEILRTGMTQNYSFSIGGGSENGNYRLSLGYLDQEGIIKDSGIKRYNLTYNSNYEFLDGAGRVLTLYSRCPRHYYADCGESSDDELELLQNATPGTPEATTAAYKRSLKKRREELQREDTRFQWLSICAVDWDAARAFGQYFSQMAKAPRPVSKKQFEHGGRGW